MTYPQIEFRCAVEGHLDEVVIRRLLQDVGVKPKVFYGGKGKDHLKAKIPAYNKAARLFPWVVVIDLDQDDECAPPFVNTTIPDIADLMCFRVAVREIESWLIADCERIAAFLGVSASRIPRNPDSLADPKGTLVKIANHSRRRVIKESIVPRVEGKRKIGPGYNSILFEFIRDPVNGWRPKVASKHSDSLARCIRCLKRLKEAATQDH